MSQESLNSNNPLENEELTEDELDAIAGGSSDLLISSSNSLVIDNCNMHTSHVGAKGVDHPSVTGQQSMNLSLSFP